MEALLLAFLLLVRPAVLELEELRGGVRRDLLGHDFGGDKIMLTCFGIELQSSGGFCVAVAQGALQQCVFDLDVPHLAAPFRASEISGKRFSQSRKVETLKPMLWAICSSVSPSRAQDSRQRRLSGSS